ncbi:MAG: dockerin type I domain-containing protein [Phycisphaerales bacterium]
MTDQNRQSDDRERPVSDRFRKDLRALYQPAGSVPPQVDKAILDQARRRLAKPRPLILRIRWAGGIAAAAAVVAIGVFLYHGSAPHNHPSSIINYQSAATEQRIDLDGNGRVDILDAFRLAKSLESRGPTAAEWDVNGDGRVDRDDVDAVALAAERVSPVSVGCVPRTETSEQEERCVVRTLPENPTRRFPFAAVLGKGA